MIKRIVRENLFFFIAAIRIKSQCCDHAREQYTLPGLRIRSDIDRIRIQAKSPDPTGLHMKTKLRCLRCLSHKEAKLA